LGWLRAYSSGDFGGDLFAGLITAILLVPQGIAFALLAGLPPVAGLYASILPPIIYALLGTSRTLSVGPVSVAAIMVASALSTPELRGHGDYAGNALILALESSAILLLMALFRMGALVTFISHPVLTGFTSGAALLIIGSQLPALLGLPAPSCLLQVEPLGCWRTYLQGINTTTTVLGLASMVFLWVFNQPLVRALKRLGLKTTAVMGVSKSGPLMVVGIATLAVIIFHLDENKAVAAIGQVPSGLPAISLAFLELDTWKLLLPSALFISLVGYVESIAIAKQTAKLRRERIDPNQELIALGAANAVAAVCGSMPVAGGFSRTMVNFAAGARTQMASIITACLLALAVSFFTPVFTHIPKATLAAIILVAVAPLFRFRTIAHTWRYNRGDGLAQLATLLGVLTLGIEAGLGLGIILTILGHLWRTSRPHIAVVGRVPRTEHFRSVRRHQVQTWPELLLIRVDENLNFANAGYIEDFIMAQLARQPGTKHLILICAAISHIDATALESLETMAENLRKLGVTLHLSEVKGPVMDDIKHTDLLDNIAPGRVFFRTEEAVDYCTAWGREG
jgi:SulP family sulfate permease